MKISRMVESRSLPAGNVFRTKTILLLVDGLSFAHFTVLNIRIKREQKLMG